MNYTDLQKQELIARKRRAKIRARRRRMMLICFGMLLLFGCMLIGTGFFILLRARYPRIHPVQTANAEPTDTTAAFSSEENPLQFDTVPGETEGCLTILQQKAADNDSIKKILDNPSLYPESLLQMLAKNEETLDFVIHYPEKSGQPPASTIGDKPSPGTIPLLLQWDDRWGYAPYGSQTIIAVSGCGPTCIAMVACGLTADNTITPAVVAAYASENGYLDSNLDTSWELMSVGCQKFGIAGTMVSLDENVMANILQSGSPIICSMGPGLFTTTGHFIVLTGYENGAFTVNDPASKIRSSKTYTYAEIQDQIKNMWSYTAF